MAEPQNKSFIGAGLVLVLASSMCCIAPLLAIIGGISGVAGMFSFLEPFRPWFFSLAVISLGYAFYRAYRPQKNSSCCNTDNNNHQKSFMNSKRFLWMITVVSTLLFTFPYYSGAFISNETSKHMNENAVTSTLQIDIKGMTCGGCELSIHEKLDGLEGVIKKQVSYKSGSATVDFNLNKLSENEIINAINETGYKAYIKLK